MSAGSRAGISGPGPILVALLALPLMVWTGCADHSVGPDEARVAQLSLAASFPEAAMQQARAIDGFRVAVSRPGQGVVAEESGSVGSEESSVTVAIAITLAAACETLLVRIELSAAGEVWYRAETTQQVCAGRENQIPALQLEWVGPFIGLTPPQLSFSPDQATNPSPQTFTLTNTGGGTMNWTASDDAPWLGVSPASGALGPGASQTVTATVTSATLNPGQYQGTVTVTDPNAANSPQTLPVSLTVIEVANSVIRGTVSVEGTGLSGVSVTLGGKESRSTTTDGSGQFQVTGLTSGSYTVTMGNLPPGVSFSSTSQGVALGVNQTMTVDFSGSVIRNSAISGTITVDGTPLAGVTVALSGPQSGTVTTDANGRYSFTALRDGGYTVTVSNYPSGVTFPSTSQSVSLGVNQTQTVDFQGTYIRTSSVAGTVTADGAGLSGITVTLSGTESRSTTTGQTGAYSFTGVRAGTYTVAISAFPAGVSFQVTSRNASVGVGQQVVLDFAGSVIRNSSISGSVTVDGSPLANVTVTLGGAQTGSVATDASGQYSFTGLTDGDYTVTVSNYPSGVTFPSTSQSVSLGVNENRTVDFSGSYIRTSSVIGRVTAGGMALVGVTVTLTGTESRATSTDASGDYQFTGLRAGSYTVTISNLPAGTSFSTTSRSASVGVGQTVRLDFEGAVIQLPSAEYSYIEACPAVIRAPGEITTPIRTTLTVGVRDDVANPIETASVLLSLVPSDPGNSVFESTFLITGPDGLASTSFYSASTGPKTFSAEITANGSTIVIQESDDLYVDEERWGFWLSIFSGNEQTITAGQSGSFSVRVYDWSESPAPGIPVGWDVEGGNCLYGFTNSDGVAGMSLYVPPGTPPGIYQINANIAGFQGESNEMEQVIFTYQVVAPATAPSAVVSSEGTPRLRGTPLPPGGD